MALFSLSFIRLTSPSSLLPSCGAAGHLFADDVQAFVHDPPSSQLLLVARIQSLTANVSTPACRQIDLTSMHLKLLVPPSAAPEA